MSPPRIVGIVGTKGPFPRLIDALAVWARAHPEAEVWVQYFGPAAGASGGGLPAGIVGVPSIARAELLARLDAADAIVTHAGSGTVRDALALGHVPIVVPRRAAHGEHINDHQLELTAALGDRIIACPEVGAAALEAAIAEALRRRGPPAPPSGDALRADLRSALATLPRPARPWLWRLIGPLTRSLRLRRE